jgi:ABC-type oligopeptide transport system substrate-binding subunit
MGYRSNVVYKIKFFDEATMKLFLAEAKAKEEYKEALEDGLEIDEEKLQIKYEADSVKWYDDYSDVQSHEALIHLAKEYRDDNEKELEYAFARIGEEDGDIETYASENGYDMVWVSRQIMVDDD